MDYRVIKGDLFKMSDDYVLAHCISADYKLGAGIALPFNRDYGVKTELQKFYGNCKWNGEGCCRITKSFDRTGKERWNVANLVTKERSFHKPTYETLRQALENFRSVMSAISLKENLEGVKIAMPLIGCGLDGLEWNRVEAIVLDVFARTEADITVCVL